PARARNVAAVPCRLRGQPSLIKNIDERGSRNAQGFGNRHSLRIGPRGHAADGVSESFAVKQEISVGMLNPSRIHDHALGMEYRIEIRKSGLEHAARLLDFRIERLDQREQGGGLPARKSRENQSLSVFLDF